MKKSDNEISDIDNAYFDEADNTVNRFTENIQLSWKLEAESKSILYSCENQPSQ
jgi:hypothetical protein